VISHEKRTLNFLASDVLYGSGLNTGELYVWLLLRLIERESANATRVGNDMKALLPAWKKMSSIAAENFENAVKQRISELRRSRPAGSTEGMQ
jgi:hypothetical protein